MKKIRMATFVEHHDVVELRGLFHADHEHPGHQSHDQDGRQVEDDRNAEDVRRGGEEARRLDGGRQIGLQPRRHVDAESSEQLAEITRPRDGDGHVAHRVLDDEVPSDDPGHELSERRGRVGVGAARDRHQRRELRITERAEAAADGRDQDRDDERGARSGMVRAAGGRRADDREDPCADDGPDAERDQLDRAEHALQLVLLRLGVGEDRVERLGPEEPLGGAQTRGRIAEERPGAASRSARPIRAGTSARLAIRSGAPPCRPARSRSRAWSPADRAAS